MSSDNTYNGYKNYETWCVNLWLNNDEASQRSWAAAAEKARADAIQHQHVTDNIWTAAEAERFLLADALKNHLEDSSPLTEPSLYSDLLNAALSEVDWHEVADEFLEVLGSRQEDATATARPAETHPVKRSLVANFPLSQVLATPGALAQLTHDDIQTALARHARGDWDNVCDEDRQSNEEALGERLRLFSVYHSKQAVKFWVITEADRSATTVLLPSEY
jgi:hypothetical protein